MAVFLPMQITYFSVIISTVESNHLRQSAYSLHTKLSTQRTSSYFAAITNAPLSIVFMVSMMNASADMESNYGKFSQTASIAYQLPPS